MSLREHELTTKAPAQKEMSSPIRRHFWIPPNIETIIIIHRIFQKPQDRETLGDPFHEASII